MKYFKYQYSDSLGEVWGLFSELANLSEEEILNKNKRYDYSHTTEIINSAMNSKIESREGFNLDDFNLKAYEIKCHQNDEIKLNEMRKKHLTIVDTINGSDEDTVGYGEISSNDTRLRSVEDAFELLEDNDEFERCLCELYSIRKDYIVEKGVDPVEMLINSLKGVPEAVNSIVSLVVEDSSLKKIIEVLCESGNNSLQGRLEGAF